MAVEKVNSIRAIAGILGAGAGVLLSLPVMAQVLNPNPSIFNEAPYNGVRRTPAAGVNSTPSAQPAEMMSEPMSEEAEGIESPEAPTASAEETIVDLAVANSSLTTLTAALEAANLTDLLASEGPYTVFAPTDEAFASLPEGVVEELLKPENRSMLIQILSYHVVPGAVTSDELTSGDVATAEGSSVQIEVNATSNHVMVNGATVIEADIAASNGVIHVIDRVIMPSGM